MIGNLISNRQLGSWQEYLETTLFLIEGYVKAILSLTEEWVVIMLKLELIESKVKMLPHLREEKISKATLSKREEYGNELSPRQTWADRGQQVNLEN